MVNAKKYSKDVDNFEDNIEKELQKKLLKLDKEEFKKYFEGLIEKYYNTLFSFDKSYNNYVENSHKKYNIIKRVKSLCSSEYNNLDNYELFVRMVKAEEIAYNQMNSLYFMESSYKRIIYYNAVQEVIYITDTLSILINLYEKTSSEELLSTIGTILNGAVIIFKEVNKLPLDEASLELDFKLEKDVSDNYCSDFTNILQYELKEVLKRFDSVIDKLKVILPEDVATFETKVNAPEKDTLKETMFKANSDEFSEEEIIEAYEYLNYIKWKNYKGYLYEIIDNG